MGIVDVSQRGDPFCAVIIQKNKRHIFTVEGTSHSEVYSYFEFRITSTPKERVEDDQGGFRELKLAGYMMRCPPTYRGGTTPKDCTVDVYLQQVIEGAGRGVAQASYKQVEEAVSEDGKQRLSGTISLTNLELKRYSPAIARRLVHPNYLPLIKADPDPERYCEFKNYRLAIRELFHRGQRVSLVTRSQMIHPPKGSVQVAERPSQELLRACRATVGNGVKRTA
ncbi:hypothetical protein RF11_08338 [Thelohanellus kitauei]|uniref:Uncharacterized protein n=1 Tax=Thelohanellus kitauei TaxID=669202 RepID=A0A0C2N284_THEKT|nr:hypothetical protein RF11_08338 [Thelohanellus kitauei]